MSRYGGYEDGPYFAEFYDYQPMCTGRQDIAFYLDYARAAGGKVLELGCGTGRVLIPMAAAGTDIVGLDLSEHMLARCREKLQAQPPDVQARVRLVQSNMAGFDVGERFSLVTTPFRPFSHLVSAEEQLSCLQCVRRHRAPGGRLIVDLFQTLPQRMHDPRYLQEAEDFRDVALPGGRTLRRGHRVVAFHRAEQVNDMEFIYTVTHPDGRTERHVQAFPFRYFFRYEVEHLLARCGFRVVALYGDFDRSPLCDDSPEMLFVAAAEEELPQRIGAGLGRCLHQRAEDETWRIAASPRPTTAGSGFGGRSGGHRSATAC